MEVEGAGEIEIKEIPGARYAVARCEGLQHIGQVWQALVTWVEDSAYQRGPRQCLEECLPPAFERDQAWEDYVFDLYEPIIEKRLAA